MATLPERRAGVKFTCRNTCQGDAPAALAEGWSRHDRITLRDAARPRGRPPPGRHAP